MSNRSQGRIKGVAPSLRARRLFVVLMLGWWSQAVGLAATQPDASKWKVGAASVDITPELPMWMSGYASRLQPAEKVAAKLHAKALAIEDASGGTLVIVTADLLGIPGRLRHAVAEAVVARYGLAKESLLINASHTHCGPELRGTETRMGELDPPRTKRVAAYQAQLTERMISVVGAALAQRVPATLAYGQAKAGFAANRRKDYRVKSPAARGGALQSSTQPVDHDVPVLEVKADGQLKAVLFGYACHNTTSSDFAFHGDYAGFAQAALEQRYPGVVALFLSGCGADQNPSPRRDIPGRSAIALAGLHGQTLALAVEAALSAPLEVLTEPLRIGAEILPLPYLPPPNRAELEKRLQSKQPGERDYAQVLLDRLDTDGQLPASYPYPISVIRFGAQLTLVALASEVVVDYSLRLKRELAGPAVWVSAYNNDFMGYIPSRRVWAEGGYEAGAALTYDRTTMYRMLHPNIWDPALEELIVGRVHRINERLSK